MTFVITNTTPITAEVIDGTKYITTIRGGVAYCAHFSTVMGEWFVSSRRLALGRFNTGGGKYVKNIGDSKPFAALPALINMGAV